MGFGCLDKAFTSVMVFGHILKDCVTYTSPLDILKVPVAVEALNNIPTENPISLGVNELQPRAAFTSLNGADGVLPQSVELIGSKKDLSGPSTQGVIEEPFKEVTRKKGNQKGRALASN
ncbi:hypothetical protein Fot_25651 [Forsythia ovata]|uniref:Uncharacterized protein n=1 Tax=Forsythia ovata TaxID=205694 RepID=A0ABD1U9M3_9LAMI